MPRGANKIKVSDEKIPETIKVVLESYFWLPEVQTMYVYERLHDDHDGTQTGVLNVMFSPDGDARVWITGEGNDRSPTLRFRMPGVGGGMSQRTRVALLILADAIRLDNEERKL